MQRGKLPKRKNDEMKKRGEMLSGLKKNGENRVCRTMK